MGNTVPYEQYAAALSTIEALQNTIERYDLISQLIFMGFIFAIIALLCYTGVKKKQVKYFGSSEEYEMFIAWRKKQEEKKKPQKDINA